jgi:hypothetical protein
MKGLSMGRGLVAGVGVIAVALLLVPAAAGAGGLPAVGGTAAPPGITISGLGFARLAPAQSSRGQALQRPIDAAHPSAVTRAVRDARRRAAVIARTLGVQVGQIEQVDLQELSQFGEPRRCPRCRVSGLTAAAATVTFAIAAGPIGSAGSGAVHASGAAAVAVEPSERQRNQPIRRALLAARRAVTPEAAATARRNARNAARSAGLTLGGIVSISEAPPLYYYGGSFYDAALGAFGPGRFCGFVNRPIIRRDPQTGVSRVVRRVRQRRCIVPSTYSLHLEIEYEAR